MPRFGGGVSLPTVDQSNLAGGLFLLREVGVALPEEGQDQCQHAQTTEAHCTLLLLSG